MADGLVKVGDGSCVTLIMENRGFEPIQLKQRMELGETTMVEVLKSSDVVGEGNGDATTSEEGSVCTLVSGDGPESDRVQKLFSQLDLKIEHLTTDQQTQLTTLLASFQDVFALDPSELGTTDLVRHVINTGTTLRSDNLCVGHHLL